MAIKALNQRYIIRVIADYQADTLAELDADLATYVGHHVYVVDTDKVYLVDEITGTPTRCPVTDTNGYVLQQDELESRETQILEAHPQTGEEVYYCEQGNREVIALAPARSEHTDYVFDMHITLYADSSRYEVTDMYFEMGGAFAYYCAELGTQLEGQDGDATSINTRVQGGDGDVTGIGNQYNGAFH